MTDISRQLAAEALGTALLVATVVGSGVMAEQLAGGNGALALLCNTIPTGAILVVLVTVLAPISGAHLNPVVSAVAMATGTLGRRQFSRFVLAQLLGGVMGVMLAHAMFELPLLQVSTHGRSGVGPCLSEAVATFTLLVAVLGTARVRPEAVPWSVGLAIVAAYWFTASTSFANPAVTVARSLTQSFAGIAPGDVPAFVGSQFAGGALAWATMRWLHADSGRS